MSSARTVANVSSSQMESLNYCRFCANPIEDEVYYLFSTSENEFIESVNDCLPVKVRKTDPLPKQICRNCKASFLVYKHFFSQVISAEKKLKTLICKGQLTVEGTGPCVSCPLCLTGNMKVEGGIVLLTNKNRKHHETVMGLIDSECIADMMREEMENQIMLSKSDHNECRCAECGKTWPAGDKITKHYCMKSVSTQTLNINQKNTKDYDKPTPVQCEYCGKEYKNSERLKDHLRYSHPKVYHKCNICSKEFPKNWMLKVHMRTHTGEFPVKCSICGKDFISTSQLRFHTNFHHRRNELQCKICQAVGFYSKQDLDNHVRTKHTKERVFKCEICDKSFMSSGVYYQHRSIHSNVKKYSCTICSKSFKRWPTLDNHLRIHNNERPFPCSICGKAFRQKGTLRKHEVAQHSDVLEKK